MDWINDLEAPCSCSSWGIDRDRTFHAPGLVGHACTGCILVVLLIWLPDPLLLAVWFSELFILAWTHRFDLRQGIHLRPRLLAVHLKEEDRISSMVDYLTHDLIFHLIIFQAVILLVILSNIWITRRVRHHPAPAVFPMVSVLIPARNEERSIAGCVRSILAQDYPSFEVLVLDDQSSDGTRAILESIAVAHPALRILHGEPPPGNQVGKNWACSQLARQAQGELLLFTDADTLNRSGTLKTIVTALMGEQADLLTGFPRQEVHHLGRAAAGSIFFLGFPLFYSIGIGIQVTTSVPFHCGRPDDVVPP